MLNIPEGLPILSAGAHPSPAEGACFMEFNALLAGLPFNDRPSVVDRELGMALQICNDAMSDEGRISLVPLLGRALGLVAPGFEVAERANRRVCGCPDGDQAAIEMHNMTTHVLRNTARKIFGQKVRKAWRQEVDEFTAAPLKNLAMNAISARIHMSAGVFYSGCNCICCCGRPDKASAEAQRTQAITQVVTWLHEAFEEALAHHGWERQVITEVPVEQVLTVVSPIRFATTTN